jgi:DHA1 family tetracycline resistance protein-like MFS transporter
VNFAYGWFVLPESLPRERRDPFRWSRANPLGSLNLLRSHAELLPLATVQFLAQFAHYVLQTIFVLYASARYGWSSDMLGKALALIGISAFVVQGGLTRIVVKVLGERPTLLLGLLCGAVGFAIYGWAPTGTIFLIGVPIMSLWGLAGPSTQALMSRMVSPSEQGKLQGANMSLASIAGVFAPMLYGGLYSLFNDRWAYLGVPGAPFFVGSGFLAVAALLAVRAAKAAAAARPPQAEAA